MVAMIHIVTANVSRETLQEFTTSETGGLQSNSRFKVTGISNKNINEDNTCFT